LSSAPGGEEEIRGLVSAYQQYQAQADAIMQQINLTQVTAEGLNRALGAVEAMEKAEDGQEMLVPIGSGSFVHAKLASREKIVLNVGAGVSIEKTVPEAKEALKARKADVAEASKKLSEVLSKIDQEMQKIQAILGEYESQMQQQQQGPGSGQVV
jgi:prefoldin alpha subunit